MRCVSLMDITQFIKNFSYVVYLEKFKPNEQKYREMWFDQGSEFWVKFVVTLKFYIKYENEFLYDKDFEAELVTFLEVLSHNKFTEVICYIENAANRHYNFVHALTKSQPDTTQDNCVELFTPAEIEEMKTVISLTILAGSFVEVLPAWETAKSGDNFEFEVPRAWTLRYTSGPLPTLPLESFIREKWGGSENINKVLGCKRQQIVWWKDTAPVPNQVDFEKPKFVAETAPPLNAGNINQTECLKLGSEKLTELYFYFKTSECYRKQYWMRTLPKTKPSVNVDNIKGADMVKKYMELDTNKKLIGILNNFCPPLLHQKYYQVNIASLASKDKTYLKVASWYALMLESTGEELMNQLNDLQEKTLKNIKDDMYTDRLGQEISELLDSTNITRDKFGTKYTGEECVENLADFLFEPCVLVELLSKFVLLRQWLSAALITVLKFEMEIMEFAHWPIPEHIEPVIRELVSIVINTKERIQLGFVISNFDIVAYPHNDARITHMVMDDVVLRTLPVLKFISSEDSYQIVKSLKHECFETDQSLSSCVQLNETVYSYKSDIKVMYLNFFGLFNFWTTKHDNSLFSTMEPRFLVQSRDVLNSSYKPKPPKTGAFYVKRNCTENPACRCCATKSFFSFTNTTPCDFSDAIIEIISKIIIPCGHFKQQDGDKLLKMFSKRTLRNKTYNVKPFQLPYEQAASASLCYQSISAYLEMTKHETGIVSCMIRASAQVSAKDQLTKLIAACALLLGQVPRVCDPSRPTCAVYCHASETSTVVDKENLSKTIKSLHEESRKQTREKLWAQFPEDWKKPVNLHSTIPDYDNTLSDVISSFEVRIGRIFWNATKAFFNHLKVKNPFPYLSSVHYLLPCFVSCLLHVDKLPKTEQNTKAKINLVNFLSSLLSYFENAFHLWIRGSLVPFHTRNDDINEETKDLHVVEYNTKITKFAMHGFMLMDDVGNKFTGGLPHFKLILQAIPAFNFYRSLMDIDLYETEPLICRTITIGFKQALNVSCLKALSLNLNNNESFCPQLQDFYFACMVTYQMMIIIRLQHGFQNISNDDTNWYISMMQEMDILMYELFSFLFQTKDKSDCEQQVTSFIEGKRIKFLKQFFDHIVLIRKNHVKKMQKVNLLNKFDSKAFGSAIDSFYNDKMTSFELLINKSTQNSKSENSNETAPSKMKSEKCSPESVISKCKPEMSTSALAAAAETSTNCEDSKLDQQLDSKNSAETSVKKKRRKQKKKSIPNHNFETSKAESTSTGKQKSSENNASPASVETAEIGKQIKPDEQTQSAVKSETSMCTSSNCNSDIQVNTEVAESTQLETSVVTERPSPQLLKCNNCGKLEEIQGSFITCPKCMVKPFPVTNYFCNMVCYKNQWDETHKAEHLEFELGLFDL